MHFHSGSLSAEERLHLQAQLLDAIQQAILAVDHSGRIIFWSGFAETLYGWTQAEVLDRSIADVLGAPSLLEAVIASLEQLKQGPGWAGEFLVRHRDETLFMARVSVTMLQIAPRPLIGITSIAHKSIERLQLEEANRLLAEASALLVDAVDYETPLITLAQLAVPQIADWCAVHVLQPDGSVAQVALAPAEMAKLQTASDWLQNQLSSENPDCLSAVLRSGKAKLISDAASDLYAVAAEINSYMIVPLIARPQTLGAITFVAAESGRRFDATTLALAENLARHIAIYLDKAQLYRQSQQLNAQLEQRVSERTLALNEAIEHLQQSEATIQTLFRISNKLNATLNVDSILDILAQEAIRLVQGESGFAGLRTAEGMTVKKYFHGGKALPFDYTWPPGQGIPGWILAHKVPYGSSDAAQDPVFQPEMAINAGVSAFICTPILDSLGEVLGYFDIRNKHGSGAFTVDDQEMLMALAPAASIAIQNALAYEQRLTAEAKITQSNERLRALAANLEMAREEERMRIARELHDQLGQALTAMKFDLAWLTNRLVPQDEILAHKSKAVTAQMDAMIKNVRRIATELRPGMLDDLGLVASIEWQAQDFEKRTGIVCDVTSLAQELPMDRAQSVAMFRIFQEALTNVARHAGAQYIKIKLSATPEALTLQVHDDGRGIQAQEIDGKHSLGLLGMQERARQLDGTFDIRAVPGDGTILTVSLPIKLSD